MGEKRFTYRWGNDIDYEQEIFYDNHKPIGFVEVVNKLNTQQATINDLEKQRDYWKNKAMTLLMQVRILTSRMTDKEVKEFNKELEDE